MTDLEKAARMALEALEYYEHRGIDWCYANKEAINALRTALAEPEQRADAHLFYAPGDVLICKESGEKVKVINGNTGPLQLANGKIALEWSDTVYGEYTLGQIMDGFIRQQRTEPVQEPVDWEAVAADQAMTIALMQGAQEAAVLAEREACAKVCDEAAHDWHQHAKGGPVAVYNACAAAIRARGQA